MKRKGTNERHKDKVNEAEIQFYNNEKLRNWITKNPTKTCNDNNSRREDKKANF